MTQFRSKKIFKNFDLSITVDGDKSISHRLAIFSLLCSGTSTIRNYLMAEDTLCTLEIVRKLGIDVNFANNKLILSNNHTQIDQNLNLYCGNSGTAMRLLIGLLSSFGDNTVELSGDKSLSNRPMSRVIVPLLNIGAKIVAKDDNFAPVKIFSKQLKPFNYESPISSAQVKSAMILAGLQANGTSYYKEPTTSRNHSENILNYLGANISTSDDGTITINPLQKSLANFDITVPNDPSSAFYFAILAAITPNSKVLLKDVNLNKTRIEGFKILKKMGTNVIFKNYKKKFEDVGDILVEYGDLKPICIDKNIPWVIDELPALSIVMACTRGKSCVKNAKELRVKESDRISSILINLKRCGIMAQESKDGYTIIGHSNGFKEATIDSFCDHRVAMSFIIASIRFGNMVVKDVECIKTSFPSFFTILKNIGVDYEYKNC